MRRSCVVGHAAGDVAEFFGIKDRPHASAVAVYDPVTSVLLTGDTVDPGRLYVGDLPVL